MAANLRTYLKKTVEELKAQPLDQLLEARYERFRKLGVCFEHPAES